MTTETDGGPLNPKPIFERVMMPNGVEFPVMAGHENGGATMRDWFASNALIGFLSAAGPHQPYSMDPPGIAAERAYEYADAMLAARNPTGSRAR